MRFGRLIAPLHLIFKRYYEEKPQIFKTVLQKIPENKVHEIVKIKNKFNPADLMTKHSLEAKQKINKIVIYIIYNKESLYNVQLK